MKMNCKLPSLDFRIFLRSAQEQDLHLLTQSQTSTSCQKSSRTGQCSLKGEAERLGTGGLCCQGGPETEAGDQGPAAPDQRELMEESC
ncbi:unnamed protein product [Boreogadus saida]